MIFAVYVILAVIVVCFSIRCSYYVDLLDKKTDLSGAFVGGVLLAGVTSLPEVFTSLSAVIALDQPQLVAGNILGSNLFNLSVLGLLIFLNYRTFRKRSVCLADSHKITTLSLFIIYMLLCVSVILGYKYEILGINLISICIVLVYIWGVKSMADDQGQSSELDDSDLSLKQVIIRFIFYAIGLVISSILITYVTDEISGILNLGTTVVGALFLGIATSLPEVTASISLIKMKNFNATMGNILGSNLFNFLIIALADLIYTKGSVYIIDPQVMLLVIFGVLATISMNIILNIKINNSKKISRRTKSLSYMCFSFICVIWYVMFLVMSM